ncbi:hypothetical protein Gotur_021235 [Gossypium turneri]
MTYRKAYARGKEHKMTWLNVSKELPKGLKTIRIGNQTAHAMASEEMLRQGEAFWVEDVMSPALNRAATSRRCMDPP